tara:strand:- start:3541 stop:6201 length:2661 start_codon:yes stop_codon:yes gene_type:complete
MLIISSLLFGLFFLMGFLLLQKLYIVAPTYSIIHTVYGHIIKLYPDQYYYGVRIIHAAKGNVPVKELEMMGFSQVKEISYPQVTVWLNQNNDLFIVHEKWSNDTKRQPLVLKDRQFGRYFFYAYENIITLPLSMPNTSMADYLRELSLETFSTDVTTSIWLTQCETLPSFMEVNELNLKSNWQLFQVDQADSNLPKILENWNNWLHELFLEHLPSSSSTPVKGEILALAHHFKQIMKQISPNIAGELSRPMHFGYILLVNSHPSQEMCDHLYPSWLLENTHKDRAQIQSTYPWLDLYKTFPNSERNLDATFIAVSLFLVFSFGAAYVSTRFSSDKHVGIKPLKTITNDSKIANQLFGELGSVTNSTQLLSLLSLSHEMQQSTQSPHRCKQYHELVSSKTSCDDINLTQLQNIPKDLTTRVKDIFSRLNEKDLINSLIDQDYIKWQYKDLDKKLSTTNYEEACKRAALIRPFIKADLTESCDQKLKKLVVASYIKEHTENLQSRITPITANDSFEMIYNTAHYYELNPNELLDSESDLLKQLISTAQKNDLGYATLSELKSLLYLTNNRSAIKQEFKNIAKLAKVLSVNNQTLSNNLSTYHDLLNDKYHIRSIIEKPPSDMISSWRKSLYLSVVKVFKVQLQQQIQQAWKPVQQEFEDNLAGRYPLDPSGPDAKIDYFVHLLGPKGTISHFFGQVIDPLIEKQTGAWVWNQSPLFDLGLDDNLINYNMQVAILSEMYFHKRPTPWFEVTAEAGKFSNQISSVMIQFGNQSIALMDKTPNAEMILWSAADPNHTISTLTMASKDGTKRQITARGDFSAFRLFDKLKQIKKSGQQSMLVKAEDGTWWAEVDLHFSHSINPFLNAMSQPVFFDKNIIQRPAESQVINFKG